MDLLLFLDVDNNIQWVEPSSNSNTQIYEGIYGDLTMMKDGIWFYTLKSQALFDKEGYSLGSESYITEKFTVTPYFGIGGNFSKNDNIAINNILFNQSYKELFDIKNENGKPTIDYFTVKDEIVNKNTVKLMMNTKEKAEELLRGMYIQSVDKNNFLKMNLQGADFKNQYVENLLKFQINF